MIHLTCDRCNEEIDTVEDEYYSMMGTWSHNDIVTHVHFCRECYMAFGEFILELREGDLGEYLD